MAKVQGRIVEFDIETDYCVVGAGPAGCVVTDRLSESGKDQVTLLEAGGSDWHPFMHIPVAFTRLVYDKRFSWCFNLEPAPGLGGRTMMVPQGKVLGGGSSINGMVYVRTQPSEYDQWAQKGCTGWSYQDVLPLLKKIETSELGDAEYRGRSGPMTVESPGEVHPLTRAFLASAAELGYPVNPDFNGPEREGAGMIQNNIKGRFRQGAAQTYLRRAKKRPNVRIETHALARRVIFEGKRAIGVEFSQGGKILRVRARREVLLCCGAVKSPHLLQLSGVGPGELLQDLGIPVVHELPGVGANFYDHLYVRMQYRVRGAQTLNEKSRGLNLVGELARYAFKGDGLIAHAMTSGALFCKSRPELAAPDLYLAFLPGSNSGFLKLEKEPGMSIAVVPSHPSSTGTVQAKTANPEDQPAIQPNYLSTADDCATVVAGLKLVRRLFAAAPLAKYSLGETVPGPQLADDDLLSFAREKGAFGVHFTTTCRMGIDPMAVVGPDLKVHGLEGIRVIDASIMPGCASGNTHAPTLLVGEKGADLVLKDRARAA